MFGSNFINHHKKWKRMRCLSAEQITKQWYAHTTVYKSAIPKTTEILYNRDETSKLSCLVKEAGHQKRTNYMIPMIRNARSGKPFS